MEYYTVSSTKFLFWCIVGFIVTILLCFSLPSKAGEIYFSAGIGYDSHVLEGNNPMAVFRLEYFINKNWSVEWNHNSSIRDGKPLSNNRPEDVSDQLSIVRRFKVW